MMRTHSSSSKPWMHAKLPLSLISPYPWSSVSVITMEAVCLIQTSPGDQGFTNVSVYLDIPEINARPTSTIADLIHVREVVMLPGVVTLFSSNI